jgi:hypothetical protein
MHQTLNVLTSACTPQHTRSCGHGSKNSRYVQSFLASFKLRGEGGLPDTTEAVLHCVQPPFSAEMCCAGIKTARTPRMDHTNAPTLKPHSKTKQKENSQQRARSKAHGEQRRYAGASRLPLLDSPDSETDESLQCWWKMYASTTKAIAWT